MIYYLFTRLYAQRKEKIFIFLIFFIGTIAAVQISSNEYSGLLKSGGRFGLEFFYATLSGGVLIWLFMLCILFVPNLWSTDFLIDKSNKFSCILKLRLGTVAYIKKSFFSNFIISTISILFVQLIVLFYTHLFLAPIKFDYNVTAELTTDASTYVTKEFFNLIIFIIFTSIGYGIFSSFIFSLQLFLKNVYVFRLLGVIAGLILYTGPILLANMFSNIPIIEKFISCFFIGYLINPGVMTTTQLYSTNPFVTYIISAIIYISITFYFMKILIKREHDYD